MPRPPLEPAPAQDGPPSADGLRQLLRTALPDKGRHKAAGWCGQTDFLLTRSHVDADGDAFHDGLFITVWKRWDFWLALPGTAPAPTGTWLQRCWARLRAPRLPPAGGGLVRQWRGYAASGAPGAWRSLDAAGSPAAHAALAQAWNEVLDYWRAAEHERRSGRPLRAQLHAALTPGSVQALLQLPVFTDRYNDWSDEQRAGFWQGETWVGARQPGAQAGRRHAGALKLGWRNGQEQPGDAPDDAHACYQIELLPGGAAPAPGTAHPPGLALSYSQRQADARVPLPGDAAPHLQRLLALFTQVQGELLAAREQEHGHAPDAAGAAPAAPDLACLPPLPPQASDAEVFGAAAMALSQGWQAAGRLHAAALRAHDMHDPHDTHGAHGPQPAPPHDPRGREAPAVLQLAQRVHGLGDAGLGERFHRRFAFAPGLYAAQAARDGLPVRALHWQGDGSALLAWVDTADAGLACWRVEADGLQAAPAPDAGPPPPAGGLQAPVQGTAVRADAQQGLQGLDEAGQLLWRHPVGGPVLCLAAAPAGAGPLLAVGTANGYLVLLKKGAAPDAQQSGTSRLHELRRILFWRSLPGPLAW